MGASPLCFLKGLHLPFSYLSAVHFLFASEVVSSHICFQKKSVQIYKQVSCNDGGPNVPTTCLSGRQVQGAGASATRAGKDRSTMTIAV